MKHIKLALGKPSMQAVVVIALVCLVALVVALGKPNLRLVGANLDSDGNSIAIIEDNQTGKQEVFDLDSDVFGIGRVQDIQNGEVTLKVGDKEMVLRSKSGVPVLTDEELEQQAKDQIGVYSVEEGMRIIQAAIESNAEPSVNLSGASKK